jgi:hypothetical protein
MRSFAQWVLDQSNTAADAQLVSDLFKKNLDMVPINSDNINEYSAFIEKVVPDDQRSTIFFAFGQLYERWLATKAQTTRRFGSDLGVIGLLVAGILIAVTLGYGIFVNETFFELMSKPDHARGLITFLFSFATIGIILLIAIAIFWIDKDEVGARFAHAKDLVTILVGILGTVLGFYFGTSTK